MGLTSYRRNSLTLPFGYFLLHELLHSVSPLMGLQYNIVAFFYFFQNRDQGNKHKIPILLHIWASFVSQEFPVTA